MISQRAKYALRALLALAESRAGEPLMISEISRQQAIPKKFLEQILLDLKRAGFVDSRRGRLGGYVLARSSDAITFGEVLRLIDGPVALLPCLSRIAYRKCNDCADEGTCEIRHVFARVAEASRDILDKTTLAEAAQAAPLIEAQLSAAI
jgi:Rrf2 family protein